MALQVEPTKQTFYDVDGATLSDVVYSMEGADSREPGLCSYELRFEYLTKGRRALPARVDLELSITIQMPRWTGRDHAKLGEQEEWDRFYAALLEHERGHSSRYRDGTRALYEKLTRTPVRELKARYREGRREIDEQSEAYDRATDHGRKPKPGTTITYSE